MPTTDRREQKREEARGQRRAIIGTKANGRRKGEKEKGVNKAGGPKGVVRGQKVKWMVLHEASLP